MSIELQELFDNNRQWARETTARDPGFFTRLLAQQTPQYLWVGCSDSRVPANEIVNLLPGELFVHRNVANVVVHSDLNALSVLQFAIDHLKVKHIMVVGHYGCGGVRAAMENRRLGLVDNWLRHVQDVYKKHQSWLDLEPDLDRRANILCELNVLEQALSVCGTTMVQEAWERGQGLVVHGWVYRLSNGLVTDLAITVHNAAEVQAKYEAAIEQAKARAQAPQQAD